MRRSVLKLAFAVALAICVPAQAGAAGALEGFRFPQYPWPGTGRNLQSSPPNPVRTLSSLLHYVFLRPLLWIHLAPEPVLAVTITPETRLTPEQLERVLEILRHRIDGLGLNDPALYVRDPDFELWIPGASPDIAQRVEAALTKDVDLRFQLVEEEGAISTRAVEWLPDFIQEHPAGAGRIRVESDRWGGSIVASDRALLEAYVEWITPRISMIPAFAIGEQFQREGGPPEFLLYVLEGQAWLTARDVANAAVGTSDWGDSYVQVEFTEEGGQRFAELTGQSVDRKLAIILDGEVVSAPVIREQIPGGRAQITLGSAGSQELAAEARELAARLSGGTLGVTLEVTSVGIRGRTRFARLLHRALWTLPGVPGLPAAHWQVHALLAGGR